MVTHRSKRRISFSLRTVLIVFTVTAVAMWAYWYGWSRWQWYVDQRSFVAAATQLKTGSLISTKWRPKLKYNGPPWASDNEQYDAKGKFSRYFSCRWPNALFLVYWQYEGSYCSRVEVFRLPPAPVGYLPQFEKNRRTVSQSVQRWQSMLLPPDVPRERYFKANNPEELAYRLDFLEMIKGDRKDDMGFDYELIYSDPPIDEH